MPSVEGGHDGIRITNEVMACFADEAGPESVTQSAMGSGKIRPAKSAMGLAEEIPARSA